MPGKLSLNAQRQGKIVEPGNALEFSILVIACDFVQIFLVFYKLMQSNHQTTNFEPTNIYFSTGKLRKNQLEICFSNQLLKLRKVEKTTFVVWWFDHMSLSNTQNSLHQIAITTTTDV